MESSSETSAFGLLRVLLLVSSHLHIDVPHAEASSAMLNSWTAMSASCVGDGIGTVIVKKLILSMLVFLWCCHLEELLVSLGIPAFRDCTDAFAGMVRKSGTGSDKA